MTNTVSVKVPLGRLPNRVRIASSEDSPLTRSGEKLGPRRWRVKTKHQRTLFNLILFKDSMSFFITDERSTKRAEFVSEIIARVSLEDFAEKEPDRPFFLYREDRRGKRTMLSQTSSHPGPVTIMKIFCPHPRSFSAGFGCNLCGAYSS